MAIQSRRGKPEHFSDRIIYLVRHGRTALNARGLLRGHNDAPLDAAGLVEARELGRLFAEVPLVTVMTSPLRRAQETAAQLTLQTKAEIVVDNRLIDRDYARWCGASAYAVQHEFGSIDDAPGVEPISQVACRVIDVFTDLADTLLLGPIAVVAHDIVNRLILAQLVPHVGRHGPIPQSTGCWNLLLESSGLWRAPVVGAVPRDGRIPWPVTPVLSVL